MRVGREGPKVYETWSEVSSACDFAQAALTDLVQCHANVGGMLQIPYHTFKFSSRSRSGTVLYTSHSYPRKRQKNGRLCQLDSVSLWVTGVCFESTTPCTILFVANSSSVNTARHLGQALASAPADFVHSQENIPKSSRRKYYAVHVGREGPKVYETWQEVS